MKIENLKGSINTLLFEITRRCNMNCRHCLCGDPQNVDISEEIIDKTLSQIDRIYCLFFTGGEPSLNPKAIEIITNGLIKYNIKLNYFGVITNGKVYCKELVINLNRLYQYCNEKDKCFLRISQDYYHEEIDINNIVLYKESLLCKCNYKKDVLKHLVKEGNALKNKIGDYFITDRSIKTILFDRWFVLPKDTVLYINVLGDVLFHCDYSYDSQKSKNIGNVLEIPIVELLINSSRSKVELIDGITKQK